MPNDEEGPIANPTYLKDIRYFFEKLDFDHMGPRGIDLATYEGVKRNAGRISAVTRPGNASMPPEPERQWSEARWQTFYNWRKNGHVLGEDETSHLGGASRVRRNIAEVALDTEELEKVKRAFRGMMALDSDRTNPNKYFNLAGLHWLPRENQYCLHRENRYNPWHRAHLLLFENAMRQIPGCEDVTLPYWDITTRLPAVFAEEPFASYKLPFELVTEQGLVYPQGMQTIRNTADKISTEVRKYRVSEAIDYALSQQYWERFNSWYDNDPTQDGIILAHDSGHGACGETIANQDVAAFDPLFWFFHANWDRLWWRWQNKYTATTVDDLKKRLQTPSGWLDDELDNEIPPFTERFDQRAPDTIDLNAMDVDYQNPPGESFDEMMPNMLGSLKLTSEMSLSSSGLASVRVKGVDRLAIPGSFNVELFSGDTNIATNGFFQPTDAVKCDGCRSKALVNFDFRVPLGDLQQGKLAVKINVLSGEKAGEVFPLTDAGDPTINVRLLLEEEPAS